MNNSINSEEGKRNVLRQRRRNTFTQRAENTFVIAAIVFLSACLLNVVQGSNCHLFLKWLAAAFYYFTVLVFAGWLFYVFSVLLRKAIVAVVCFAVLFVWGSASYFVWHVDDDDAPSAEAVQCVANPNHVPEFPQHMLEAPNRAISAFFPSRGGFERIDGRNRLHYFIFHLMVFAFVAAVMFSHFGRGLVNRFKKRFVINKDKLNVFWGVDDVGLMLARNIVETTVDQHVAFLLPEKLRFQEENFKSAVWRLDLFGATWVLADFAHLTESNARGHRHFFLDKSGHRNVSLANQLVEVLKKNRSGDPDKVYVYVRVEADEDEKIFTDWAAKVNKVVTPVIIRESDTTARRFILDYPMLDCPGVTINPESAKVSGSFKVLLLGFGATGQSILREVVSNGQFVGVSGFSVDVIERNLAVVEAYESQHSEAIEKYKINFIKDVSAEGVGFEAFLEKSLLSYNRIVVCLSGDIMNIRVASRIAHYVTADGIGPKPGVLFVRVFDPKRRSYFAPDSKMTLFGDLSDVYSLDTLNHDPIDKMAKVLHGEWASDKSDAGLDMAWRRATFFEQRSSRASALGERSLARVLGFEIVPKSDPRPGVSNLDFLFTIGQSDGLGGDTRERILAEDEHLRWNAYHRMLGYSCWDMKKPSIDDVQQKKANQLDTFGKHACLVGFDELPNVDYTIARAVDSESAFRLKPEDFRGNVKVFVGGKQSASLQAYDFKFVRKIWENADNAGMKLVRG